VEGGAARTNNPNVLLALTSDDGDGAGVSGVRFSNNGSTWSAWEKPAAQKVWTLAPGDGVKTVRAQFRDKAGNVSVVYTDTILLDQTPPTGAIVINGGASVSSFFDVFLEIMSNDGAGSGVSRMRFSNNGSTWSPWEAVAPTKGWALDPGDGVKTVRVQFMDRAGNVSAVCADTLVLDQTPPMGSILINSGALVSSFFDVFLTISWNDGAGSGVFRMRFSNNGSTWSPWEAVAPTKGWALPGAGYRTVRVQFVDRAGNVSPAYSDYINVVPL
ncbi:MAG TPA: Ig-like domain repeat protein, partial [Candidatus Hydrogenedentes bacterium]|nr:Ig-like domain repeat protein [Candidatus Hydrogenedentota bacterium]